MNDYEIARERLSRDLEYALQNARDLTDATFHRRQYLLQLEHLEKKYALMDIKKTATEINLMQLQADNSTALKEYYKQAGALQNNAASQSSIGNQLNVSSQNQQMKAAPKQAHEFGVLMIGDKPLPADWRGAYYETVNRQAMADCWRVTFTSKWSDTMITVRFDLEKFSGAEVNAMAQTYLEAINQQRQG